MDKNRKYDGQPHTHAGERGKEIVVGLTMRDIADCMVIGMLEASGIYLDNPCTKDLWKPEHKLDFSPGAAISATVCNIEKMMKIFPNIEKDEESSL